MTDHHTTGHLRAIDGGKTSSPRRLDDAKARMQRWRMKHGERLKAMHPDVATEIVSLSWGNILADRQRPLTEKDLHECLMRVASRMRIQRYRFSPPGDEESARQLREIVAELRGEPRAGACAA